MSRLVRIPVLTLLLASVFTGCSNDDSNPTAPIPNPVANFSMTGSTIAPATITFTNFSTNANSYQWDFGDGRTSRFESPQMTFNTYGTFVVRLTAINSETQISNEIQRQLKITLPDPIADFSMSGATTTPATITFTNLSTNAGRFEWDFGDGRTSTQQNPVVTYNDYGVYLIKLIAIRSETPQSDEITKSLTISPGLVYIESIRIEQIPFTDNSGSGWDFGSGPDVFWSIDNANGTQLKESETYYEDIAPGDLPITFNLSPNYRLPNASAEYTIWLWDYDPADANDLMIGGTFDLSDEILAGDYYTELLWNNPSRSFRMLVTIRWQ